MPALRALAQDAPEPTVNTPLGNSFTYQGKLHLSGVPANGQFDFRFELFDSAGGGPGLNPPGPREALGVPVTDGIFTVQLDFGAFAFSGHQRWLEVRVKPMG